MSFLRHWRKSLAKTQFELAFDIGENHKTYSAYERGSSPIPSQTLSALRALGYDGPSDQRLAADQIPLTREDLHKALADLKKSLQRNPESRPQASCILPLHVQRAWEALAEENSNALKAPYGKLERAVFGRLLGLVSEEIAGKGALRNRKRFLAAALKSARAGSARLRGSR